MEPVTFPVHPLAEIFPLMDSNDFGELKEDIEVNGQSDPIIIFNGTLLDGRNRLRACNELGKEPRIVEWSGECGTPSRFIYSKNIIRRHLTDHQITLITAKASPIMRDEEAAARADASKFKVGWKGGPGRGKKPEENGPPKSEDHFKSDKKGHGGGRAEKLAAEVGVSKHTARQAIAVADSGRDDVAKAVIAGTMKLADAVKEVKKDQPAKPESVKPKKVKPFKEEVAAAFKRFLKKYEDKKQEALEVIREMIL